MRPEWRLLLGVPWQSVQESWGTFLKSGAKPWVNPLSIGFVWLLHDGGQAPKFLIPERDVVQCRSGSPSMTCCLPEHFPVVRVVCYEYIILLLKAG